MRRAVLALLVGGCLTGRGAPQTHVDHERRPIALTADTAFVAIDAVATRTTDRHAWFDAGAPDDTEDAGTQRIATLAIDLATGACTPDATPPATSIPSGFLPVSAAMLDAHDWSTGVALATGGFLVERRAGSGRWELLAEDARTVRGSIAFPVGEVLGVGPRWAVTASALATIRWDGPYAGIPVPRTGGAAPTGPLPWVRRVPVTAAGVAAGADTLRTRPGDPDAEGPVVLEVVRDGAVRVSVPLPAAPSWFEGTALVAAGDQLYRIGTPAPTTGPAIAEVFTYPGPTGDPQVWLLATDGGLWRTELGFHDGDSPTPGPLSLWLGRPLAIRGERVVFLDHGHDVVYIHDRATGAWTWRSFAACVPSVAR